MIFGGFQKTSLIDYPGKIAAVVFLQGCNFRCPFCHNPSLIPAETGISIFSETEILNFLKNRIGKIEAVVITGGEPTIHNRLPSFMAKLKKMNYQIKLDTNGSHPRMIKRVLEKKLADYIAMDIKAPFNKYDRLTGIKTNPDNIKQSIFLIRNSKISYEFRTTPVRPLLDFNDIIRLFIAYGFAGRYKIQPFNQFSEILDQSLLQYKQDLYEEVLEKTRNLDWDYSFFREFTELKKWTEEHRQV